MFKHWQYYVKDSYHIVKVLTDHNNLKNFINVQELNKKQVKWVIKLLICDFEIMYKLNQINLINALLKWSDYKNKNISANYLLLTLQQKLTRIKSLNSFIFIVIRKLYCIWMKNNVKKMSVYSINIKRYSAKHVEDRLQDEIYCT